jgi:hypothetical protein
VTWREGKRTARGATGEIAGGAIVSNTGGVSTLSHFAQALLDAASASGDAAAQRVKLRRETGVLSIIPSSNHLYE